MANEEEEKTNEASAAASAMELKVKNFIIQLKTDIERDCLKNLYFFSF